MVDYKTAILRGLTNYSTLLVASVIMGLTDSGHLEAVKTYKKHYPPLPTHSVKTPPNSFLHVLSLLHFTFTSTTTSRPRRSDGTYFPLHYLYPQQQPCF
jgi:hypothetical protein